jgi:hypothetical protein
MTNIKSKMRKIVFVFMKLLFACFEINVKWNKKTFKDVEVDTSVLPVVLKAQLLFSLIHVSMEQQKLMIKGQTIGYDSWGKS